MMKRNTACSAKQDEFSDYGQCAYQESRHVAQTHPLQNFRALDQEILQVDGRIDMRRKAKRRAIAWRWRRRATLQHAATAGKIGEIIPISVPNTNLFNAVHLLFQ
jgi:hypothetical protein